MTDYRALCVELTENLQRYQCWYIEDNGYGLPDLEALLRRARAALAEDPVGPTTEFFPISFDSRLPGPEDVNKDGYCWLWDNDGQMWRWIYIRTRTRAEMYDYTHWLSANALYIPEAP